MWPLRVPVDSCPNHQEMLRTGPTRAFRAVLHSFTASKGARRELPPVRRPLAILGFGSTVTIGLLGFKLASSTVEDSECTALPSKWTKPPQSTSSIIAKDVESATQDLRDAAGSAEMHGTSFHYLRFGSNPRCEDEYAYASGVGVGGQNTLFWAVYDGHAGWATSRLLREYLISYISYGLSQLPSTASPSTIQNAIKQTFCKLDDEIGDRGILAARSEFSNTGKAAALAALAPALAGSCALVSIYEPSSQVLRVACTGDSRAVLGSLVKDDGIAYTAIPMSKDQTGFNKAEVERISAAHPGEQQDILSEKTGRLLGIAVTRAFGDFRWKWEESLIKAVQANFLGSAVRPKYATPPYMTAEPVIEERKVKKGDFLIMASDGLWDHISSEDAVECISQWIQAKRENKELDVIEPIDRGVPPDVDAFAFSGSEHKGWKVEITGSQNSLVVEDANPAVHLVKNAFGGARRSLFCSVMTLYTPISRQGRDDTTVQVIFF